MWTFSSYTASYHVKIDESHVFIVRVVDAVTEVGTQVRRLGVAESNRGRLVIDLTCDLKNFTHQRSVRTALKEIDGVFVFSTTDQTPLSHIGGKIGIRSKVPLHNRDDLSHAYTPGVARVCTAVHNMSQEAHLLIMRTNTVAVVSDRAAVLGLGDIGSEVALPVMEGRAVLFKEFGGTDAWPVVPDTKGTEEIISIVKAIAPTCGGINLEDISASRCFEIEERLRAELDIPVFHDDQHGTAIMVLSALTNAFKLVGKKIGDMRIVVSGVGAADNAIIRLLLTQGVKDIVGYERSGALAADETEGIHPTHKALAEATNPRLVHGSPKEEVRDANVFIGVSHGDILDAQDIATMADKAIVFTLANPTPKVDPLDAAQHAVMVATGRSDYPNQINNVLTFPGLFRGLLDAKIKKITTEILRIATVAIASVIPDEELSPSYIIPGVFDERVVPAASRTICQAVRDLGAIGIPIQGDIDNRGLSSAGERRIGGLGRSIHSDSDVALAWGGVGTLKEVPTPLLHLGWLLVL